MRDSKPLLHQIAQEIAQSANSSPTGAGPISPPRSGDQRESRRAANPGQVDAINQVFELFRINYHNQYYSAYSDVDTLHHAKRLWLETLSGFDPATILSGAKRAIECSEYLPTLHKMIRCCKGEPSRYGLPDPRKAYIEACQAPSPKAAFPWSHPAVYHAGRATDWYFLASNPEKAAFPVFEHHYLQFCERVIAGEQLPPPCVKALPRETETQLSKAENLQRLQALRRSLQL